MKECSGGETTIPCSRARERTKTLRELILVLAAATGRYLLLRGQARRWGATTAEVQARPAG